MKAKTVVKAIKRTIGIDVRQPLCNVNTSRGDLKDFLREVADENYCIENLIFEVGLTSIAKEYRKGVCKWEH